MKEYKQPIARVNTTITAFNTVVKILEIWGCTKKDVCRIFNIKERRLERFNLLEIDSEQELKISYILNIYAALSCFFNNPDNIHGFMSMKNNNGLFKGDTPLNLILNGDLEVLESVHNHVISLMNIW